VGIRALDDADDMTARRGFATLAKARSFACGKALKGAMSRAGARGKHEIGFALWVPQAPEAPPLRQPHARAVLTQTIPRRPRPNLAILVC